MKKNKINLFFENNGVTTVLKNRKPFLNAIPSSIVSKVILPPYDGHHAEAYFGTGSGQFFNRFNVHTSVPTDKKFYYPIIYSLSQLVNYVNKLSIPDFILQSINNGSCKILIVCAYEGWPWRMYDALIEPLANQYNIPLDKFVVMTGNITESSKYKNVYFSNWEVSPRYRNTETDRKLGYDAIFNRSRPRKYKFICLNRRATHHRFAGVTKFFPFRHQGLLSFGQVGHGEPNKFQYYNYQKVDFAKDYPRTYKEWKELKIESHLPLLLPKDLDPYDITDPDVNPTDDQFPDKFYDSYLNITSETTVLDTGFFSEKTFKSVIYFQPFVLIGQHRALEFFKNLGYKTFSDVIDESYDSEPNNELRLEMAANAAYKFINRTDLDEVMKDLWPIFEHNYNNFVKRFDTAFTELTDGLRKNL
tara:strand:+ start:2247 stop:3497 length:1251 start_codon:yes stop_codon:yes gene_type:complete